jgi:hypothetical protein
MAVNPYKNLPRDKFDGIMQEFPAPFLSKARYTNENATASSVISVSQDTTSIEITANGGAAIMRWVATSDTQGSVVGIAGATANYDHVIAANTIRRFAIPIETMYQAPSSMVGANRMNGLYQRVAIKTAGTGAASVLVSEF